MEKSQEKKEFIEWKWCGNNLKNISGSFNKNSPFLRFFKKLDGVNDYILIYETNIVVKGGSNVSWNPFNISLERLCNSKKTQNFVIQCCHKDKKENILIGEAELNLQKIKVL